MMWLVIASLLLAAAIQGIGYYQQASFLYQMKSDAQTAAEAVTSKVSTGTGDYTNSTISTAVGETAKTANVSVSLDYQTDSYNSAGYVLRTTQPNVTDKDVVFLSAQRGSYSPGVHIVPKGTVIAADGTTTVTTGSTSQAPNMFVSLTWAKNTAPGYITATAFGGSTMFTTSGNDVIKSANNGSSWTTLTTGSTQTMKNVKASKNGSVLIASADFSGYVWTSVNGGATWTQQNALGATSNKWASIAVSGDGSTMLVSDAATNTTWVSTDSGATWTKTSLSLTVPWRFSVSGDGSTVLAYTSSSTGAAPMISKDHGATWQSSGRPANHYDEGYVSGDGKTVYILGYSSYVSKDSGSTWSNFTTAGSPQQWTNFSASEDGTKLTATQWRPDKFATFNGSDTFITSSDGGNTWTVRAPLSGETGYNTDTLSQSADGTTLMILGYSDGFQIGTFGP